MRKGTWVTAFLIVALSALALCSQLGWASVMGWSKVYGGPYFDNLCSMAHTADGGCVLAGYTDSFGHGLWLVKVDVNGTVQWNKTYSGIYGDRSAFVIQSDDGGYAIASYTSNSGSDFWLIKTDALGNPQWNKTYGGASYDIALSIIQTPDSGYALVGYTDSFGGADLLLVKTHANGTMQWNITYILDECYEFACSLILTNDGGYAIGTSAYSSGTDEDFWLLKTDSLGHVQWNETYRGGNSDYVSSIRQTNDGGYILAGRTYSYGENGDGWLVKTDVSGDEEWNMTYGGAQWDEIGSVIQTTEGGYIFAGITDSFGDYDGDFWLVKTGSLGNIEWNRTYDVGEDESACSLTLISDDGYVFAGTTRLAGSSAEMCLIKTDENGMIPEFPLIVILPLFMMAALLTAIVYKRKRSLRETPPSLRMRNRSFYTIH